MPWNFYELSAGNSHVVLKNSSEQAEPILVAYSYLPRGNCTQKHTGDWLIVVFEVEAANPIGMQSAIAVNYPLSMLN